MENAIVRTTLQLVPTCILLIFGVSFVGAWLMERKRGYLLMLAGACALFALGATSQTFGWPPGTGPNAVVSGALYTAAVVAAAEALLRRSHKRFGLYADVAMVAGITALLAYFFYVERSLIARVYIQSFGYGLILLVTALRLSALARGRMVDRVLFWVLLVFAVQFFPRTLLTIGFSAPAGRAAFANSVFWQALQLSLAVLGAGLAMAILAAAVADVIDDLRRERERDHLTGVFNRRGFEERIAGQFRHGRHALVLCDIDRFKSINDAHGHDVGDMVLQAVARALSRSVRETDVVGRMGGEEFAVWLPHSDAAEAHDCAERLRATIAHCRFDQPGLAVTASFGVGTQTSGEAWATLYKRVDARLYDAKRSGRNRTISDQPAASDTAGDAMQYAVSAP